MVHSSTHLGFSWHLAEFLEDALVLTTREEEGSGGVCSSGGGWLQGKKNRRQKFREQGGPSRESLQRSHIVSILRQIPALRFESCHVSSCRRSEPEVAFLRHGWVEVEGKRRSSCEEQVLEGELPVDVLWPLSAVSELGVDEIFRVDWGAIPASADPLRGFGYKAAAPTKRRSLRGECTKQSHGCGGHGDENGEKEEGGLARGARKRSQVESIATALKFLNLPAGMYSVLRNGSAFFFTWADQLCSRV